MAFSILLAYFFSISLLLLLVSYSLLNAKGKQDRAPWHKLPPGPTKLPIIGNLHQLGKSHHRSLHRLSQKYGPLMYLKLGSMPTVVASSAEAAMEILKTHDLDCCTRSYFTSTAKLSYGRIDISFCPYGILWKNFHDLDVFYERVIEEHIQKRREREGEGEDTMDALLRKQTEATHLTKEHIKAILINIFIGGTDTTSTALEWAMTELMRHPAAMKRAQDEVRSVVGNKGKVEESDLPRLAYMKCVIKEVFSLPAKTRVLVNAFAIGRDEGSWKDPEVFKPERFIGSAVDLKGLDFELLPFGAGRRTCPGMHVGMAVIELALANLLYSFNWELPQGMSKEDIRMDEEIGGAVHRKFALHLVATKYSAIVV